MPSIIPVERRWPGATVVCLAPGPTLTEDLIATVAAARVPVIAVNDAHRLAPWADVLYSSDRNWWRYYDGVPTFGGARVGIGTKPGDRSPVVVPSRVAVDVLTHTGHDGLELSPDGLRSGLNSGYAAINLAVHTGAARIVLLGYTLGEVGGRSHFFGSHPKRLHTTTPPQYATYRRAYDTLVAPLRALGVVVVNATPGSWLDCFPRVPLGAALPWAVSA